MGKWIKVEGMVNITAPIIHQLEEVGIVKIELTKGGLAFSSIHNQCDKLKCIHSSTYNILQTFKYF